MLENAVRICERQIRHLFFVGWRKLFLGVACSAPAASRKCAAANPNTFWPAGPPPGAPRQDKAKPVHIDDHTS